MIFGIGFKVTVIGSDDYREEYGGWSEGEPVLEAKAKAAALEQGVKYVLKKIAGPTPLKVADILSKPMQGMAEAVGEFIVQKLKEINRQRADLGLQAFDLDVSITGDFEANYRIEDGTDLDALPKLLAALPRKGDPGELMGAHIIEKVYLAHVNFARHQYNFGNWSITSRTPQWLEIRIAV